MKNYRKNRPRRTPWAGIVAGAAVLFGAGIVLGRTLHSGKLPRLPVNVPSLPGSLAPAPPPQLAPTALLAGKQDVAVLMYHDVTEHPTVYFDVTTDDFRAQMKALKKAGAHVISIAQLYDHLRNGTELPPRAVAITFDDGYIGQYDNAYPILKEFKYPATFFVHTKVVGVNTGRAHMSWDQLKALDKEGLISVECHTVSHPDDLRKCPDTQLHAEMWDSKKALEEHLGRKIRFLAYPVGNADGRVAKVAHEAGYEMCFTMGPDWARAPADAFFVPRFLPRYFKEIAARLKTDDLTAPIQAAVLDTKAGDLESGEEEDGQVKLKWVRGGRLWTVRINGRRDVPAIVKATEAQGGLNGAFFSDARVNSAGAGIVGPILSHFGPGFAPGLPGDRERIEGRPLILIGKDKIAFLPFQKHLALDETGIQRLLPGATDCFIAGAWLVHDGKALDHDQLEAFRLSNIFDFRPRAFFGVDGQGRVFLGASSTGNESNRIAETLEKLGLRECVLLDSGFSTSLVKDGEVLVTGIRRADMPARPVPHALVMYPVDRRGEEILAAAPASGAATPAAPEGHSPRERENSRWDHSVDTGANAPSGNVPAGNTPPGNEPAANEPGAGNSPAGGNDSAPGDVTPVPGPSGVLTMTQLQELFRGDHPIPEQATLMPAAGGRRVRGGGHGGGRRRRRH